MGIGHRQQNIFKTSSLHRFQHGGTLRQKRNGRGARPLSTKDPLHVVFKINNTVLRARSLRTFKTFSLTTKIIQKYALEFAVKIEQLSIQYDHIHILIRAPRRSRFHSFFRVVSGQMAQEFTKQGTIRVTDTPKNRIISEKPGTKLWKHRPFSRVVRGWRAYKIVRDYIQLNEKEALGEIRYQKNRLRGLSSGDWLILWR